MAVNLPDTHSDAGAGQPPAVGGGHNGHGGSSDGGGGGRAEARRARTRKAPRPSKPQKDAGDRRAGRRHRPWWIEIPAMAAVGLVFALLIKTCLFQVFTIPSGSMENTLRIGDRVGVNKLAPLTGWEPEAGQPVVFKDPGDWLPPQPTGGNPVSNALGSVLGFVGLIPPKDDNYLVKRVIATGGQTVQCSGTTLTVNGAKVDEPYLHPGDDSCAGMNFGPVTVPQGYVWVEGDHRSDSADSRYHQRGPGGGAVPVDNVVGPVSAVVWPLSHLDWFGWVGR
ncbi:signal peptidase I [Kitasatospora sp. NPDC092286]|uniref:signal peptidase I n=1 Tax=Kitasatospora sp. NPDC092286 TaxID=3364087 RepID=UPI0038270872